MQNSRAREWVMVLELEGAGSLSFEVHRHHSCEPREHHVPHLSHELCGQPLAERQHEHESFGDRRELHDHAACVSAMQLDVRSPEQSVMVFTTGPHDQVVSSLPHRIRSLRLRLADHRLRFAASASAPHGEDPSASHGSSSDRMALLGKTRGGQREEQPMGPLEGLRPMRSEGFLQDERARRATLSRPNSGGNDPGDDRAGGDVHPGRDRRRDGHHREGQDHGSAEPSLSRRRWGRTRWRSLRRAMPGTEEQGPTNRAKAELCGAHVVSPGSGDPEGPPRHERP